MGRGREREGDTGSKAGSRLWAVSTEPDLGLELTNRGIMTWAEVRHLTDWATQVSLMALILLDTSDQVFCRIFLDLSDPFFGIDGDCGFGVRFTKRCCALLVISYQGACDISMTYYRWWWPHLLIWMMFFRFLHSKLCFPFHTLFIRSEHKLWNIVKNDTSNGMGTANQLEKLHTAYSHLGE